MTTMNLPVPGDAYPRGSDVVSDLHREWLDIVRRCTKKQRAWLYALPDHAMQGEVTARALGIHRKTPYAWRMRSAHIRRALEILDELQEHMGGYNARRCAAQLAAIAQTDVTECFNDDWSLKPKKEWTYAMRLAVEEVSFDAAGRPKIRIDRMGAIDRYMKLKGLAPDRLIITDKADDADLLSDAELAIIASAGSPAPAEPPPRTH